MSSSRSPVDLSDLSSSEESNCVLSSADDLSCVVSTAGDLSSSEEE